MAEWLTIEHYVGECTLKCAQVILSARIPRTKCATEAPEKRSGRWVSVGGQRGRRSTASILRAPRRALFAPAAPKVLACFSPPCVYTRSRSQ